MIDPKLTQKISELKSQGKKITLVTGVFDVLHVEHRRFLDKAKELGTYLLVGIESDARVRKIKGEGRPVNKQDRRKLELEKWRIADGVFILPESFESPQAHQELIESIRPDFLAVSSHTKHLDKKKKLLEMFGGRVVIVHQHNPEISTTQILSQQENVS